MKFKVCRSFAARGLKKSLLLAICVCSSLMLHACGGAGSTQLPPPPPAAQLAVSAAPATTTAGTALNFTVTARGTNGAVASNYGGTVHFTSTDSQAVLPADSKLTNGTGAFAVTFKTAGGQSLSATDTVTASIVGTCGITVNPGPTTQLIVTPAAAVATSGLAMNVTAGAQDAYGNAATNYTGTVKFSSSDGQATLPANEPLTNGSGAFSVTLKTVGPQTVTATDTVTAPLTKTSSPINVVSNAPTHLSFNGIPGSATTRQSFKFTVNALDAANDVAAGYSGTVQFSSSDSTAKLPPNTVLVAGVSGSLSATFESVGSGSQTFDATDMVTNTLTVSATIRVTTATALKNTSGAAPAGTVGDLYNPHPVTVCLGIPICQPTQVSVHGFPLTATGGVPGYNWSWSAASGSSLPPGLSIYDAGNIICGALFAPRPLCISGKPTQPGTFNVVVNVTDSGNPPAQASATYPITINKPPAPWVIGVPTPAVVNQPYTFTFSAGGYPPFTWSESGALPAGLTFNDSNAMLSGTPTQTGSFPFSVTATDQFSQSSQPGNFTLVVSAHGFVADGNMTAPRALHTSTLLKGGKVLITGGTDFGNPPAVTASAELYDPSAGTFSATGNMQTARVDHTATLLNDGRVLVAGGCSIVLTSPWASAELYDPTNGTFTSTTGNLQTARCRQTATLLSNGKVLITGGIDANATALAAAELFDPASGTFTATGSMQFARVAHTATLLPNGKVLVTGGAEHNKQAWASAELYDPGTGAFTTVVGTMTVARAGHTATLLNSGKVLLAGGADGTGVALNTAELFDPLSASFTATTNMVTARVSHTATLLKDNTVLLAGGADAAGNAIAGAEIFDPVAGSFASTGGLVNARAEHTATLLPNGAVLVTGGIVTSALASAELYQ